jgi:hypothetical protein
MEVFQWVLRINPPLPAGRSLPVLLQGPFPGE